MIQAKFCSASILLCLFIFYVFDELSVLKDNNDKTSIHNFNLNCFSDAITNIYFFSPVDSHGNNTHSDKLTE